MSSTFGKIVARKMEVHAAQRTVYDHVAQQVDFPSLGLMISFEQDYENEARTFMVIRSLDGAPIEVRPVASNTIGVRRTEKF